MERRGFFKSIACLFAAGAASPLIAADRIASLGASAPATIVTPAVPKEIRDAFRWWNIHVFNSINKEITWPTRVVESTRIDGELPHQFGVDFNLGHADFELGQDEFHQRYVWPTVAALAEELRKLRPSKFGLLPLPDGVDMGVLTTCVHKRWSMRGLRAYDIGADGNDPGWVTRFDILCG